MQLFDAAGFTSYKSDAEPHRHVDVDTVIVGKLQSLSQSEFHGILLIFFSF